MASKKSGFSSVATASVPNFRDSELGYPIEYDSSEDEIENCDTAAASAAKRTNAPKKGPMDRCTNILLAFCTKPVWHSTSLFELLDVIVEEVGEQNVVQVITDNGSNHVAAAYWWRMFRSPTQNLQKLAIRILSCTCNALGCERNWSVFEQQLKQGYNATDEIDPISLNEIDVSNEWLVGEMDDDNDTGNDLVFDDDEALNWRTAVGAGSSTRKQKAVQQNDEDLEFEDVEPEEHENEIQDILHHFEASDGEEGEGDAPIDNNEEDYIGVPEDD
ncbi:hypothetical protein GmHk_04G010416 [Glycine max]|nr:hypothetical protein GmHk_04G010416 [Glycine max]